MSKCFSRSIDVARIVACFMVVMLHVAAVQFHGFDERWWAASFYDAFTRAGVPVFLMITGVLLLNRREALSVFFRKRYLRILPPLLFWSFFYLGWYRLQGVYDGGPLAAVRAVIAGPVAYHLWYLYAIAGIYLFVPFLRHIWQSSSHHEKRFYLFMWVAVSGWPVVAGLAGSHVDVLNTWELGMFFGLAGYLFMGAHLHDLLRPGMRRPAFWWGNLLLFLGASLATVLATWWYSAHRGQPDPLFLDYLSPLVIASAGLAFCLLIGLGGHMGRLAGRTGRSWAPVTRLAASTLGIYCAHVFVLDLYWMYGGRLDGVIPAWLSIPVGAVMVFVLTWALVSVLRLLRPLRYVT